MTIGCNIWMICLQLNWFVYGHKSYGAIFWICMDAMLFGMRRVFNNFLLIDATDRSKISSDQKRFFIALNLYPLSFFANTPFNILCFNKSSKQFLILSFYIYMNTIFMSINRKQTLVFNIGDQENNERNSLDTPA